MNAAYARPLWLTVRLWRIRALRWIDSRVRAVRCFGIVGRDGLIHKRIRSDELPCWWVCKVTCAGSELENCVEADPVNGWARCYQIGPGRCVDFANGYPVFVLHYGPVEIRRLRTA